jgi:polyisoprenoid-binding protein YceI
VRGFPIICAVAVIALSSPAARAAVELAVDPGQSYIAVRVEKGGLLAFAGGHRHGLLATGWTAGICWEETNPAASAAQVMVRTSAVVIDTPEARQRAGIEERGPGTKDIQELQTKVLAAKNLSAGDHPEIRFATTSVRAEGTGGLVLSGPLTIRGQSRNVSVPVRLERRPDGVLSFSGEARVKQSDYGIKPESIGGVVNVKDEVTIRFQFAARRTERACR